MNTHKTIPKLNSFLRTAKNYVAVNGGKVVQYGAQAMVLLADT
jgi:hypothetical protein